ncbi:hypothetical protein WA026_004772 [Henosepilachna vigintioctopunctata]|uniref:Uncharacterized protein n=1 Tax=Henosepilachna vigintioctopunctata TaxID=420089 RepID=A0AAW1V333_9CUCU
MDDDELTKLAVEELIREGKKFVKKRELTYTFEEPTRMKPNLRYFKNTLNSCISSNKREERARKSNAAEKMQHLEKKQINKTRGKNNESKKYNTRSYKGEDKKLSSKTEKINSERRKLNYFKKADCELYKHCIPSTSQEDKQKKGSYRMP